MWIEQFNNKKHYSLLISVFNQAVIDGKIINNPAIKVKPPKVQKRKYYCYDMKQLNKLFQIIEGEPIEIAIKLASLMGLRREEIDGLKWENVELLNRTLSIIEVKTVAGKEIITKGTQNYTSERTLAIPDQVYELLIKIKKHQHFCWRLSCSF
ncbi:MAG: hypothetical protein HFJ84_09950 [Clostridiales bacterium]|nr:hypothetical protein [Clostridiales bacterium]